MIEIPKEFDEIRPYTPEELPAAYESLIAEEDFREAVAIVFPNVPFDVLKGKLASCKTGLDFQKVFCYPTLEQLAIKRGKGMDIDCSAIDNHKRFTFMSNHRDIVLDSAFLSVLLLDAGFDTTAEIAIGDNLLAKPWIKTLIRISKAFIVQRALTMRQMLQSSARLGRYIHFVINEKHDNVWIAQREGRAKDSDDRTQTSILKMMCMGGEGTATERLKQLHIVPTAISYEFDPCDYLKAKEFQQKRDTKEFKKSKEDDIISMKTGIFGYKGHIHYQCAPCIDEWLDALDDRMSKTELFEKIAVHIDHEIHRNYRLYPSNFIAMDLLSGNQEQQQRYTMDEKTQFESYIGEQLSKIEVDNKDDDFLRERMLTMYANPAINYLASK